MGQFVAIYALLLRLRTAMVAAVALTVVLASAASPPALAALAGPTFVYPTDGQTLGYGSFLFKVNPVDGASGYLYGFFQNGNAVWENYHNEHTLSGTEYGISAGSPGHRAIQPGALQVWVRALVDGQWTDATIININITNNAAPDSGNSGQPSGGGQNGQPQFYCVRGPNGGCMGQPDPTQPTSDIAVDPRVFNAASCLLDFLPGSKLVNFEKVGTSATGIFAVYDDYQTGKPLLVPLDTLRLAPTAGCVEGLVRTLAPGQLEAIDKCENETLPYRRQCENAILAPLGIKLSGS
jgi:hypothetical protein